MAERKGCCSSLASQRRQHCTHLLQGAHCQASRQPPARTHWLWLQHRRDAQGRAASVLVARQLVAQVAAHGQLGEQGSGHFVDPVIGAQRPEILHVGPEVAGGEGPVGHGYRFPIKISNNKDKWQLVYEAFLLKACASVVWGSLLLGTA